MEAEPEGGPGYPVSPVGAQTAQEEGFSLTAIGASETPPRLYGASYESTAMTLTGTTDGAERQTGAQGMTAEDHPGG